jgi:hypothetical protein
MTELDLSVEEELSSSFEPCLNEKIKNNRYDGRPSLISVAFTMLANGSRQLLQAKF